MATRSRNYYNPGIVGAKAIGTLPNSRAAGTIPAGAP
jgi:hypothetical protein